MNKEKDIFVKLLIYSCTRKRKKIRKRKRHHMFNYAPSNKGIWPLCVENVEDRYRHLSPLKDKRTYT